MFCFVFFLAKKAYNDLRATRDPQSIVICGRSGSGKTESAKYILNYLCGRNVFTKKIREANPLLEAFGNAKTTENTNSSRFGKFIHVSMTLILWEDDLNYII